MTTDEPFFSIDLNVYRDQIKRDASKDAQARLRFLKARETLRASVVRGIKAGLSENESAKLAGVERKTVRDWIGKR